MPSDNDSLSEIMFDNTEFSSDQEDVFQPKALLLGSKGNEGSSSDINSLKLENINLNIKKENLNEDFYDLEKIQEKDNLYDVFASCDMLIFVDNIKIQKKKSCFSRCKGLKDYKFPGCTFLPFEYVNYIKKYIHELNTQIAKNNIKNVKILNGNDFCNSIYFDEGDMKKIAFIRRWKLWIRCYLFQ